MFVYFIIILSRSQQFPTSSSQNQVELGEWATGHFMHWALTAQPQKTKTRCRHDITIAAGSFPGGINDPLYRIWGDIAERRDKWVQETFLASRGVTIHLVTIRFVLQYTASDTLHDTIFAIHISDILFILELSIAEDLGDRIYG